jgi:hypothetical protein
VGLDGDGRSVVVPDVTDGRERRLRAPEMTSSQAKLHAISRGPS